MRVPAHSNHPVPINTWKISLLRFHYHPFGSLQIFPPSSKINVGTYKQSNPTSSCHPAPACPGLAFYHLSIYQLFFRAIPRPTNQNSSYLLTQGTCQGFRHPYCLIPTRLQKFSSVIEVAYQSLIPHHLRIYQSFPGTIHRPISQKSNTIVFQTRELWNTTPRSMLTATNNQMQHSFCHPAPAHPGLT